MLYITEDRGQLINTTIVLTYKYEDRLHKNSSARAQ